MRILQVIPSYVPAWRYGGPIRAVHSLSVSLATRGHDVAVVTTNVDGKGESDVPLSQSVLLDGVRVFYHSCPSFLRRLYWSPALERTLRRLIPLHDVVHLHSVFLWPTYRAARIAAGSHVPYIVSPRGMLVRELMEKKSRLAKSLWLRLVERRTLEGAAAIHATSDLEKAELSKFGYRLPSIAVIANGLTVDEASNTFSVPFADLPEDFLIYIGRINWKKGLDRLFEALVHAPTVYLVVVGNDEDGYTNVLRKLAAGLGVLDRIIFVGEVRGEAKRQLIRGASGLVLSSYSENFGNVVIEALAEGCPVAVTSGVGLSATVRKAGAGIVLSDKTEQMGRQLQSFMDDEATRMQMGIAGKALVEHSFSWESIAGLTEELYRGVVRGALS